MAPGMDDWGRFLVAYQGEVTGPWAGNDIFVYRFDAEGNCICGEEDLCPAPVSVPLDYRDHGLPSVSMSREARVLVGWLGCRTLVSIQPSTKLSSRFDSDLDPFVPPVADPPATGRKDHEVSAGTSDLLVAQPAVNFSALAWSRRSEADSRVRRADCLLG
ncbi:MAG: hypothetical protein JXQ75_19010, partial [Phycisphaerae bacterium]|nr:hypothetical protein [Phycisphaerae bacterium]